MAFATRKFAEHAALHMPPKTSLREKNYDNFRRSGAPKRVMIFSHGEWKDLAPEVVERLRDSFLVKRTVVVVPIDGRVHGSFDFLGKVLENVATGEKWSIAWIDENGQCFFPDEDEDVDNDLSAYWDRPSKGDEMIKKHFCLSPSADGDRLVLPSSCMNTLEAEGNPKPLSLPGMQKLLQHLPIRKLKDPRSGDNEQLTNVMTTLYSGALLKKGGPVRLGKSSRGPLNARIDVLNPEKPVELCSLASESNLSHASDGPGLGGNGDVRIDMPNEPSSGGSHGHPTPPTEVLHSHNGNEQDTRASGDGDGDHRSSLEVADSQSINARAINEDLGYWIAILCAVVTIISIDGNYLLHNGKALRIVAGFMNLIGFILSLSLLVWGSSREDCLHEDIKNIMKRARQVVVSFAFVGASCLVFPDKYIWLAAGSFWLITAVLLFSKPLDG